MKGKKGFQKGLNNPSWKGGIYTKEYIKEKGKEYRQKNKNHIIQLQKNWLIKNIDRKIATNKRWEKKYPEKLKFIKRIIEERRRALKQSTSDGSVIKQAIEGMLIGQNYQCKICNISIKDNFHIDHILPISLGGNHIISNIQLLCPRCNIKKSNKI